MGDRDDKVEAAEKAAQEKREWESTDLILEAFDHWWQSRTGVHTGRWRDRERDIALAAFTAGWIKGGKR